MLENEKEERDFSEYDSYEDNSYEDDCYEDEPVMFKKVTTSDPRFHNKAIRIISEDEEVSIPVPDDVVLCGGCNENIHDPEKDECIGYLIYTSKQGVQQDAPYDVFCESCFKEFFPKAMEISS